MADKKYTYFKDITGRAVKAPEEDQSGLASLGLNPIGLDEALSSAQASQNNAYVNENWGTAGIAAEGIFGGATLGLGPALAVRAGLMDEGHLRAAESSPIHPFADALGMVAPAILSGGESVLGRAALATPAGLMGAAGEAAGGFAERIAGRVLGESAGVLGKAASVPIRMASQGATEGALMNLGHQASENLIQNKPLAAEALAAMTDGALYGGLIGGGLGTFGAIGHAAVDSMGKFTRSIGGTGDAAVGRVARDLSIKELPFDKSAAKNIIREQGEILKEHGSYVGDMPRAQVEAAKKAVEASAGVRAHALEVLEDSAPTFSPGYQRIDGRFHTDIEIPASQSPDFASVQKEVQKIRSEFENVFVHQDIEPVKVPAKTEERYTGKPGQASGKYESVETEPGYEIPGLRIPLDTEKPTWTKLVEFRDKFAETANSPVRRQALNILDSEISFAMKEAGEKIGSSAADAATEYAAATVKQSISREMEANLTKKLNQSVMSDTGSIGAKDLAVSATVAATGSPVTGAGFLASKGIGRMLQEPAQRFMAKMAYENAFATSAAHATVAVRKRMAQSLDRFFKSASKAPSKAAIGVKSSSTGRKPVDRAKYEADVSRVQQLISNNHLERVRRMADTVQKQGHPELAAAMMALNQRAVMYAINNMPPRKGAKSINSLRPIPVSKVLDMYEHAFTRKMKGYDLFSVLDNFESGDLSRDEVRTWGYLFPEQKNEFAAMATAKIAEMKSRGEYMDLQKISTLGLMLDAPVDRILEGDYVGEVQMALNTPMQSPQQNQQPPQQVPAIVSVQDSGLLTTTQQMAV